MTQTIGPSLDVDYNPCKQHSQVIFSVLIDSESCIEAFTSLEEYNNGSSELLSMDWW